MSTKEDWVEVVGHIKSIIVNYDHVNDDPHKTLSDDMESCKLRITAQAEG
jgi:hypothetical protein